MKKAIYKIENKVNHKIYIGQSVNPTQRWKEHISKKEGYTSLIHQAIEKYGVENFDFTVLGWFEDYNEKEKEYILQYRSLTPYGYNIMKGGEEPPHFHGEKHPMAKIDEATALNIIKDLQNWKLPRKSIVAKYKITQDIIRHINEGDCWRQDDLSYPIRPGEDELDKFRVLYIQWKCCSSNIPLNQIGALVGWGRSSAKMINQGHNHKNESLKYPLRNNKEYNLQILCQETCIDYLHFEE